MRMLMIGLLAISSVANAQDKTAKEIVEVAIDSLIKQDEELRSIGFSLYLDGESIRSNEPNRSRSYERIAAAGPGYYYRAINRRRVQETEPQITDINQLQHHVDEWQETIKFKGQPRLVRNFRDSIIYQPASVRDS
ncbi:MAG: hypothetical protein ACR2NZ_07430 [Rubripirellula sp.]